MIKPLVILFNTISVFLFTFLFGDSSVTLTGNFPKNATPDQEFVAEIKISKGSVSGFAKLQVDVPQGFTVKELESKFGNFSFTANTAKIIWTSIPSDAEFTVKFTISADASAIGLKTITSKFSYVNNNQKESTDMTPAEITITSGATLVSPDTNSVAKPLAAQTPVENASPVTTQSATPSFDNPVEPLSNVIASRKITKGEKPNEYMVDIKIKKGTIKGFAKYQEVLPAGFIVKGGKTNNSSFSISDGKAKYVWVTLPPEEELNISYTLERTGTAVQEGNLSNGEFSYLEDDQSKKVKLIADNIPGVYIAEQKVTEATADNIKPIETISTNTPTAAAPAGKETVKTEIVKTETIPDVKKVPSTPVPVASVARKEGNVNYRVQVGAFRNAIQSTVLSKKFNLTEPIKSEMAEGFSKFMVGSFNEYKEARTHREEMKQKGCNSAFVTAYNGAKRITVQEALMITSQKWFK